MNEISKYIFGISKAINTISKERYFDINYDYENYFPDFLKYNINLNKDDIDWWEFNSILNAILKDDNSNMAIIIKYRTYEKPSSSAKTQEQKQHRFNLEMKRKFALPNMKNLENGFQKLWDYTEKKVGDTKE